MASQIVVATNATSPSTPVSGTLALYAKTDNKVYTKDSTGTELNIGQGATGGGSDLVFYNNGQTVTTAYSIPANTNAMTAGKITINAAVTVPTGSRWVIVG